VPIPVIDSDADTVELLDVAPERHLNIDAWIKPPVDGTGSYWSLESNVTDTYGLWYYLGIPCYGVGSGQSIDVGEPDVMRVESIGDILYIKIHQGDVVDVEPEEVPEVTRMINDLFR
jgi:hypothetical protein